MASTLPCLFEKRWPGVIQGPVTIDADSHIISMASTKGLHPKQKITLTLGSDHLKVVIQRVVSSTSVLVIPFDNKKVLGPGKFAAMLAPFSGSMLAAPEQERNKMAADYAIRAVYEEEPVVALRTIAVDDMGCHYNEGNPFPVTMPSGSFTVNIDSAKDPFILNIPAVSKSTEYSFTLPIGTRKYNITAREDARIQYSFITGETDTNFITIPVGGTREFNDLDTDVAITVYFEVSKNDSKEVVEVEYWL